MLFKFIKGWEREIVAFLRKKLEFLNQDKVRESCSIWYNNVGRTNMSRYKENVKKKMGDTLENVKMTEL